MGGKSTSHSAVLDSKVDSGKAPYDLRSWQGLTEVLRDAKASLRTPEAYAEFRNLVLAYAKEGGDTELRKKIDHTIATFGTTADLPPPQESSQIQETAKQKDTYALGGRRMQPRFVAGVRFVKSEAIPSISKPEPVQTNSATIPPPPPVQQRESKVQDREVPESPVAMVEENVEEKKAPEPIRPVEQGIQSLEAYKNRITEIKRIVREQVGNPAALIDTHNELGKRYMVTLLGALKATGGSGSSSADVAMRELETAFSDLVASTKKESESKTQTKVSPEAPISKESSSVVTPKVTTPIDIVSTGADTMFPPLKQESTAPVTPTTRKPASFEKSIFPEMNTGDFDTEVRSNIHDDRGSALKDSDAVVTAVLKKQAMGNTDESSTRHDIPKPPQKTPSVAQTPVAFATPGEAAEDWDEALSSEMKYVKRGLGAQTNEKVAQEVGIDPRNVAVRQSELFTDEITKSLHELLQEWKIFSSSGLFGTGPGGPEHPLYIRLAPLSMGEVVAGRWEGANPKTQKAIKEYIDAWRHEQGIAYTINETFEHYLRRVLQKILKRQKQSMGI